MADNRVFKEKATQLLSKGKLQPALVEYQKALKADPADLSARQKAAEVLARLGKKPEAIEQYTQIVSRYAREGQFFKATAICKVILQIDPEHKDAHAKLADLYSKRMAAPSPPASAAAPVAYNPHAPLELDTHKVHSQGVVPIEQGSLQLNSISGAANYVFAAGREIDFDTMGDDDSPVEEIPIIMDPEPATPTQASSLPVIPLFSDLSREDFMAVLQYAADIRAFNDGEAIVKEGDPGNAMYAIVQGKVSVVRQIDGQAPKQVARMNEGDLFGEMALVSASPRLATILADGPAVVMEFAKPALDKIIARHPSINDAIQKFYRQRLLENLLRSSPLLHPLSEAEKQKVANSFQSITVKAGDVLLNQGVKGDGFYMLLRGQLQVFHKGKDGKEHPYPPMREGDAFGEISALLDQPATASVRAYGPVVALKLSAEKFRDLLLANPAVKPLVMQLVNERLSRTADLVGKLRGIALDLRV